MVALPAMVYAQQGYKYLAIIVKNGDTTVNGKKMSELKPDERRDARKAFADFGTDKPVIATLLPQMRNGNMAPPRGRDTARPRNRRLDDSVLGNLMARRNVMPPPGGARDRMPVMKPDMSQFRMPVARPRDGGRDVQDFNFGTVDKNGIATRENFHVSDVPPDIVKKLAGVEVADLNIFDITFVPEFSTGKISLSFSLSASTVADVSLLNSDTKAVWTEKSTGAKFSKSFMLPLNGMYYLIVKQGGKAAVKRVVKE